MGQCLSHLQQLLQGKRYSPAADSDNANDSKPQDMAKQQKKVNIPRGLHDQILGTIFGNCIGDAIGLITEFLTKKSAAAVSLKSIQEFESSSVRCTGL